MSCASCATKFNIFKHKRTCIECSDDFCSSCLVRDRGSEKRFKCHRCRIFCSIPLDHNALMNLKVKDLRWYLSRKGIPTNTCTEKSELVDLILQQSDAHTYDNWAPPTVSESEQPEFMEWEFLTDEEHSPSTSRSMPSSAQQPPTQDYEEPVKSSYSTVGEKTEEEPSKLLSVEDLKSLDEIDKLSVRQLKLILTRNFIDYSGCCEKSELQDKVQRLWLQLQDMKKCDTDEIKDENLCKICMEGTIDCVLLECGHMVTCTACGKRLSECPICRQYVVRVIHIFKA